MTMRTQCGGDTTRLLETRPRTAGGQHWFLYNRICSGRARVVPIRGGPGSSFSDVSTSLSNKKNTKDLASSSVSHGKRSNICYDWNKDNCAYNPCKYRHICSECSGRHPLTQCKGLQDDPQRRSGHTGARPHS